MSSASSTAAVPVLTSTPPARSIIDLGMDVHKESITIAVLPAMAKGPTRSRSAAERFAKTQEICRSVNRTPTAARTFASPAAS